jgi:molybdopterin molybdotransferase
MSLLPVEAALARILAGVEPLAAETVPLAEAAGRVLATDLAARRSQPPFAASAMDGYAVRAAEATAGATLAVTGMSAAGHRFAGRILPGEAVRIFTGAPVPEGADAILIQEDADPLPGNRIGVRASAIPGRHIRLAALDFAAGDVLLRAGRRLGFRELSLAAAMGHGTVAVRRRPTVVLISTGDELVPPGTLPGPDQIVASNALGLAALAADAGANPYDLGIVRDNASAIAAAVDKAVALPADVIVTLGGASVGEHDLARTALEAAGMRLDFWKVAIRPGKPLMFGAIPGEAGRPAIRVLGLPGNPVSALVGGLVFLDPLVAALLGLPLRDRTEPAVLAVDLPANDGREDYLRSALETVADGLPRVTPLAPQDSSMLSTLVAAGCLIVRPSHAPPGRAGDPCRIIRLP